MFTDNTEETTADQFCNLVEPEGDTNESISVDGTKNLLAKASVIVVIIYSGVMLLRMLPPATERGPRNARLGDDVDGDLEPLERDDGTLEEPGIMHLLARLFLVDIDPPPLIFLGFDDDEVDENSLDTDEEGN
mmetsp:Transcript_51344/g.76690  ORF Transcript_51344/g.76690 Transcript_51344/m.76690 type:complete len:133 (-) Transcript_51344:42-440(-)|eukprot:CAMPEP_0194045310 /NCGR_PEP_ID=MMETSP0009_2-20130614/16672_1 /TAXON_ID=210454 /ORGANISM="Grammatophora oceanica, Strain CCMP 410" /LENGTH=132 /DNA_ID=CAMNT_0038690135 /DNA_START=537 /DNA_END=935 /DNA_ORIENTATION=+